MRETINVDVIYEELAAKSDMQKIGISAMIYAIISEPVNGTGYTRERDVEVKKVIFGKYYNTFEAKIFTALAYCGATELGDIMEEELGRSNLYRYLFKRLCDVEICGGVKLKSI